MALIYYLIRLYEIILFVRIFMSWVRPDPNNPFVRFIHNMTEPVLEPIRRNLPIGGFGFDFSPIIVFVLLELIRSFLFPYAY